MRHVAPLLADVARLALGAAAPAEARLQAQEQPPPPTDVRQEVLQLIRQRMATSLARSLAPLPGQPAPPLNAACAASGGKPVQLPAGREEQQGSGWAAGGGGPPWAFRTVGPGQAASFQWDATHQRSLGRHGVLLLVSQAQPCRDFSLLALGGDAAADGTGVELAGAAQPLPPLVHGVQQHAGGPGRER